MPIVMRHVGISVECTEDRRCGTCRASGANFVSNVTNRDIVLLMRQRICYGSDMAIWCSVAKDFAIALPVRGSRRCRERAGGTRRASRWGLMSSAILRSFGAFLLEY